MKTFLIMLVQYLVTFNLIQLAASFVTDGADRFNVLIGIIIPILCAALTYYGTRNKRKKK